MTVTVTRESVLRSGEIDLETYPHISQRTVNYLISYLSENKGEDERVEIVVTQD